jgi:hypothetical protein
MAMLDEINSRYDEHTANAVCDLFNKLAIPAPDSGEYTRTTDKGFILFLNEAGIVVRLTSNEIQNIRHDNILQPFGSRLAGHLRADLFPGVLLEHGNAQLYFDSRKIIDEELEQVGLVFNDAIDANIGYIHERSSHKFHPVIIDPDAYRKEDFGSKLITKGLLSSVSHLIPFYAERIPTPVQDRHYAPLHHAFSSAWPKDSDSPDQEKITQMWDVCRDMKAQGILKTAWLSAYANYKNMEKGSQLYASRHKLPSARHNIPVLNVA